ncbi:putative hydrolase of the HAD superfamily [Nocardioides thalensis]|uniref:Putative hydrolase of the HAD superfamily n=1 Tax=Nocardioides thalensis TaxID=1914755 RepID=A0A853C4Z1_9ACTN|nr:HAD-IA family hydrolase [Nocardioides thalensis]NYJ02317.1 putative hydrolase of the HAD superfamily [Nocardioides thalensis]
MSAPYAACLIDVFGTALSVDFERYNAGIAERAGVDAATFIDAVQLWAAGVMDGSTPIAEALERTLRDCGASPNRALIDELVTLERALLHDLAVLHDDTLPFLELLREKGVRTAFVSNCSDNTGPLLEALGLTALVEELVLSCEVGSAKPSPGIYEVALERLDVFAEDALFVDDQQAYCEGAAALGIRAVRIDRAGWAGDVSLLTDLTEYF